MSDIPDGPDEFSEAETLGVWTYIDEETGEEVTVPDDDCDAHDEEGGE